MTKLRHLVWMLIATGALVLSTSQGFAQSRPDAAEPEHDEPQQALTERPLTGIGRHQ